MAKVEIENPKVITFSFRQEKGDPDYGTCLWARFHFDTQAYTMFVESDCGSYSYGWVPTPNSETFLHLMARCEGEYILGKISSMTEVDVDRTFSNLSDLLSDEDYEEYTWQNIRSCIEQPCIELAVSEVLDAIPVYTTCIPKEHEIYECFEYDYPRRAKIIAQIFEQYIRPAIQEMRKEHG